MNRTQMQRQQTKFWLVKAKGNAIIFYTTGFNTIGDEWESGYYLRIGDRMPVRLVAENDEQALSGEFWNRVV